MVIVEEVLLVIFMLSTLGFGFVSALRNTDPQMGSEGATGVGVGMEVFVGVFVRVFVRVAVLAGMGVFVGGLVSVGGRVGLGEGVQLGSTTGV